MKISSSFLSIKEDLKENIDKLTKSDIDYLHMDIMDGIFVPNKTDDKLIMQSINNNKPLDIHLMVEDVKKYVDYFKNLKPYIITFHYEANCDIIKMITYIKSFNIKVGLAIKPKTNVNVLIPFLPYLDLVLIMSVEPGYGGQKFIVETIDKVKELKKINKDILIEVDGGINNETISLVNNVDIAVVGSYITSGDYNQRIKILKESIYG